MTPVIVPRSARAYVSGMRQTLAKLLLLFAVLMMMPFGMAVPATAAVHHPEHAMAAMPSEHCPDHRRAQHGVGGECTMACAAALPALAPVTQQRSLLAAVPAPRLLADPLPSLHPETATPPPRFS